MLQISKRQGEHQFEARNSLYKLVNPDPQQQRNFAKTEIIHHVDWMTELPDMVHPPLPAHMKIYQMHSLKHILSRINSIIKLHTLQIYTITVQRM